MLTSKQTSQNQTRLQNHHHGASDTRFVSAWLLSVPLRSCPSIRPTDMMFERQREDKEHMETTNAF